MVRSARPLIPSRARFGSNTSIIHLAGTGRVDACIQTAIGAASRSGASGLRRFHRHDRAACALAAVFLR